MVDLEGEVFGTLHRLDLGVPLWCVADASRVTRVEDMALAIAATYAAVDWGAILSLASRARTMIVSRVPARGDALHALSCGLMGYLAADLGPDALRRSIEGALRGEHAYQRDLVGEWLDLQRGRSPNGDVHGLTPRQLEVLTLVARGAADKEIALTLGISTATAQKHVTNILERLRVPNRAAAVAAAFSPAASWIGIDRGRPEEDVDPVPVAPGYARV
ncbi:MAG: response regulator transcription factor [Chloroflexota bacterium]|nr:response regulator transcription factor [Chloroflexota bacterium]MDE3101120.1 response regulator transcription factor [Chloroflexota bacterium]